MEEVFLVLRVLCFSFFFDPGLFTGKVPDVIDTSSSDLTSLIDLYFLQCRHIERKYPFYSYCSAHFSDGKGLGRTSSFYLDDRSPKELGPCLLTFFNAVIDRYRISC